MLNKLMTALRTLLRKSEVDRELDEELRHHLEQQTEQNIRLGMDPEEARYAARKAFGGVEQARERSRDARSLRGFEEMAQDLRYGGRALLKKPVFTLAVIFTLALGVGANTAVFSVFNGVVLKPLPYKNPDRLVNVRTSDKRGMRYQQGGIGVQSSFGNISPGGFHDWRERSQSFESISAHRYNSTILSDAGSTAQKVMYVGGLRVASRFFETYGMNAQLGRTFTDQDYSPDAPKVVIFSNDIWTNHYGADPQIIGRSVSIDGLPHTVVGVMPPGFWLNNTTVPRVWIPYFFSAEEKVNRKGAGWNVVARLRPDVSFDQAQTEMDLIAAQLEADYPENNRNKGIVLIPSAADITMSLGGLERLFFILLCAVGLVLLIACVNVANLMLVRAAEREREFALRAALGASRGRLLRQLLTESLLLAALGGGLGLLLGANGMRALAALMPGIPRLDELRFDWQAFAFTAAVSLVTGLLFGLVPAIRAARPDLQGSLKEGGRGSASSRRVRRMGNLLVIGEVALAMLLLVGAGLIVQSFIRLQLTDPGFATGRLLTVKINVPDYKYGRTTGGSRPGSKEFVSRIELYGQVEERLCALPGVESAAVSARLPVENSPEPTGISIDGRAPVAGDLEDCAELRQNGLPCHGAVGVNLVTAAYFRTVGTRLIRGRLFDDRDRADTPNVALINETAARKYWPDEDPVGKSFTLNFSSWFPKSEIIGVVSDIKTDGMYMPPYPEVYRPDSQLPSDDAFLIIRTKAAPEALAAAVREEMGRIDRDIPLRGVRTMEAVIAGTLWYPRLSAWLLGLFAALAAALAAAGLYGVMSYSVNQRTQEIGLRMALGAQSSDALRLVIGEGFKLTAVGLALGLVAAFALNRLIAGQLFGVTATDPLTYAGVAMLLAMVALIACYLPARRAAKVDPLVAIRRD
jgi:putative ABC transport system permease protein